MRKHQATRTATLLALVAAVLSTAAVLYVGHDNPSVILIAMFVLWVTVPFLVLIWLYRVRMVSSTRSQAALRFLGYGISGLSIGVYGFVASGRSQSKPAFWFLIMPVISLLLIAMVLAITRRATNGRDA